MQIGYIKHVCTFVSNVNWLYYYLVSISKVYALLGNGSVADVLDNNFCQSLQNFEHQLRCTNNLLQSLQQNNPGKFWQGWH